MNLEGKLRKLLRKIAMEGKDAPAEIPAFSKHLMGEIPEDLISEERKHSGNNFLLIIDDEYEQYYSILDYFGKSKETEWMSKKEHKEKLWHLLCNVHVNRDQYKRDACSLNKTVNGFIADCSRSTDDYDVIFRINNFELSQEKFGFWDCVITKYNRSNLISLCQEAHEKVKERLLRDFENKTIIIVKEQGTHQKFIFCVFRTTVTSHSGRL